MAVIRSTRSFAGQLFMVFALAALLIIHGETLEARAQAEPCVEEHRMQAGESLATIAATVFGTQDAVAIIIDATNRQAALDESFAQIRDPNLVEVGWKICIPAATPPAGEGATVPSPSDEETVGMPQEEQTEMLSALPKQGVVRGIIAANRTTMRSKVNDAGGPIEQNAPLMESALAARSGEDGLHPLSIEYLRRQEYPGSPITIEATLPPTEQYNQYLVSYLSEGLKLYAAMTVPVGEKPASGWPVVIFNHGYIEPSLYSPTERYTEYINAIAARGYIVLRPDMRGHGDSEGDALGAYGVPDYTIDVLNALASIRQYPDADPARIGMWGHSMGGFITARAMVVSSDIRAGVIWAGVVAPYADLAAVWGEGEVPAPIAVGELPVPSVLANSYGMPADNPEFWNEISANSYVGDMAGPVQLHHGTADVEVPVAFSDRFYADLIAAGKTAEYYVYPDDDHNIAAAFDDAMRRSLEFLDLHVKGATTTRVRLQGSQSVR